MGKRLAAGSSGENRFSFHRLPVPGRFPTASRSPWVSAFLTIEGNDIGDLFGIDQDHGQAVDAEGDAAAGG